MAAQAEELELWGGVECSIVRTRDGWRDQVAETGHRDRIDDIDLIADLGIRTVRYPLLWESIAPERLDRPDFGWTDERMARLRERGTKVIATLLHHGSGPHYTHLLDPDFAPKLADFAGRVAERYPWIDAWTPTNEPLTTARFSGLYGHWYPHRRDYPAFLGALVNQCLGTVAAMAAIRARIPGARLVQTEDLGKTFSTEPLRYQAAHENGRRWLSLDLLCGRIDRGHRWRAILHDAGVAEASLETLETGAGRPDLIGINHYLTSERFLDHRSHLYPGHEKGGNGRDHYVDAEAVRVKRLEAETGLGPRLREAWSRYGLPIALTEVHHGCTRDEQLRWVAEAWRTAEKLREQGVGITAVTLWSLFGNVDWRSLLTERLGHYDCGAFDTRGARPRATVIATAAARFARGEDFDHPVLDVPGWWRRPSRLYAWNAPAVTEAPEGRPLLINGGSGILGQALARICTTRGLPFRPIGRGEPGLCDHAAIGEAIARHRPWAVIDAAGPLDIPGPERDGDSGTARHVERAVRLARACAEHAIPLLAFSSGPWISAEARADDPEEDAGSPIRSPDAGNVEAERPVPAAHPNALTLRAAPVFGPRDRDNFAFSTLSSLARGETVSACPRTFISPTYLPDLCHAALDLLIDGERGVRHVANQGRISWHGFARSLAARTGHDPDLVIEASGCEGRHGAGADSHDLLLRPLDQAIDAWIAESYPAEGRAEAA
ncbi:family 1 glycosylhydrolase [Sphingosinicella sp. CPCC 101087]|uniref:family 1 glycosylhydrolase n=1 Tax=Sphingosinicella sp. CPCC 101087 TaxID=2497754 RepID=UPI00101C3EAC|nr:family 1 glycosylhydrolase [Sphingosinicella sp. CPCC 101087]